MNISLLVEVVGRQHFADSFNYIIVMLDESNSQLTLKFPPTGTSTSASQYNVCTGLHDLLSVKLFSSLIQGINATCDMCIYLYLPYLIYILKEILYFMSIFYLINSTHNPINQIKPIGSHVITFTGIHCHTSR